MSCESKVASSKIVTKDKRQKTKAILILVFIAGVFACTKQEAIKNGIIIADSDKYEATIFRQNCAVCHGKEAYGKEVDGKLVPSLRYGEAAKKTREEIYQQIAYGKLPMPSFKKQLTEQEINQMVDFVMYDLQLRERKTEKQK